MYSSLTGAAQTGLPLCRSEKISQLPIPGRSADVFLDNVLTNLKNDTEVREMLDPLRVDDVQLKQFEFYNITIHNLLSLLRKGPATTQNRLGGIILTATLEVNSVTIHIDYIRQKRLLRLRGDILAQIERITFSLKVSANVLSGKVALKDFEVIDLGQVRLQRITGVTPVLNKLAEVLLQRLLVDRNRDRIRQAIQEKGREALENALMKADSSLFSF
ncbi:uncharacterized protein LOC114828521 [Galendromus occidentalis]|uniref:Uncharacterized protein LOC114828521 n=1 Tax=Galendromus occidentalis TaxID=34638 RepID=A0AAJ7WIX6_9ACAR|nr:uncharacterized protein LOC114828521 [Galendromus occidentalis]